MRPNLTTKKINSLENDITKYKMGDFKIVSVFVKYNHLELEKNTFISA